MILILTLPYSPNVRMPFRRRHRPTARPLRPTRPTRLSLSRKYLPASPRGRGKSIRAPIIAGTSGRDRRLARCFRALSRNQSYATAAPLKALDGLAGHLIKNLNLPTGCYLLLCSPFCFLHTAKTNFAVDSSIDSDSEHGI